MRSRSLFAFLSVVGLASFTIAISQQAAGLTNECMRGLRGCSGAPISCVYWPGGCNRCEVEYDENEPGLTANNRFVIKNGNTIGCGSQLVGFVQQGECGTGICGRPVGRCGGTAIEPCAGE